MRRQVFIMILSTAVCLSAALVDVHAAEIKVLSSVGFKPAVEHLADKFSKLSGHTLHVEFGTSNALAYSISVAKRFDVAILTPSVWKELSERGHLLKPVTNIARSGVGIAVRAGLPKPELSNGADLFGLLARARSIAYAQDGASGIYFLNIIKRHGLAFDANKLIGVIGTSPLDLVAKGEAELGIQLISEIKAADGVELVGPFPSDFQTYTVMAAGISAETPILDAANDLVDFLRSAPALKTMRELSLEPVP